MAPETPKLSIVTTACNEAGNVAGFLDGALAAGRALGVATEILYFDDGSTDGTAAAVEAYRAPPPDGAVRLFRHPTRRGITAAIQESVALARGDLLCFLPADLESRPEDDVPILYRALDDDTDVVVGWRRNRADGKTLASTVYNALNRWLFGVAVHDANWVKIVRRDKLMGLRLRADWHRFLIPILVHGGCRIKEVETVWHRRRYGRSKFGLRRFPPSVAGLLALKAILACGGSPLLFFLWWTACCLFIGCVGVAAALLAGPDRAALWFGGWMLGGASWTAGLVAAGLGFAVEFLREAPESEPLPRDAADPSP